MAGRSRIITLPDMQYMNYYCPQWMEQMFDYCLLRSPDIVLSMGDMMEDPSVPQLIRLQQQFGRLASAGIKALPLLGNHDYSVLLTRETPVNDYLANPEWVVPYQVGRVENVYTTITLSGRQWIIFNLECYPRQAVVDWVKSVLAANPTLPAILVTHGYLYFDGTRYDYLTYGPSDPRGVGPHYQQVTTPAEGSHDGGDLWRDLVSTSSQIKLVLCGHSSDPVTCNKGAIYTPHTRADNSLCYEILQDFQEYQALGGGWVTEYEFDEVNHRLLASTYSPYWSQYLYPSAINPSNAINFHLPMP